MNIILTGSNRYRENALDAQCSTGDLLSLNCISDSISFEIECARASGQWICSTPVGVIVHQAGMPNWPVHKLSIFCFTQNTQKAD